MEVHVQVMFMDGSIEDVSVAPDASILDVKQIVSDRRDVPAICYQALFQSEAAPNMEKVSAYIHNASPQNLVLAMIVSMSDVREMLSSDSERTRIEAMEILKSLGPRGGHESYEVALNFAQDMKGERVIAMEALVAVAPSKDEHASRAIAERVLDRSGVVRDAATKALIDLANDDFKFAASMLLEVLKGGVALQVRYATEGFVKMAEVDEERSVATLVELMDGAGDFTMVALVDALSSIAAKGHPDAIFALSKLCVQHHREPKTLCSAVTAMAKLAEPGDEVLQCTMLECLKNSDAKVKETLLLRWTGKIAKDDGLVIPAVCSEIASRSADARKAAAEALPKMVTKNNEHVIDALCKILQNEAWAVCYLVAKLMPSVVEVGNDKAINALTPFLDHPQSMLKKAAHEALCILDGKYLSIQ